MMGWTPGGVVNLLTEPIEHDRAGNSVYCLNVCQWSNRGSPTRKPVDILRNLLSQCSDEKPEAEALAAIPPNLFVYSEELASAHRYVSDYPDDAIENVLDWDPNLSGIEALIVECPEPLRLVHPGNARRSRTQRERSEQTAERHAAWQEEFIHRFEAARRRATGQGGAPPKKSDICRQMARDPSINPDDATAATIERIVKVRSR